MAFLQGKAGLWPGWRLLVLASSAAWLAGDAAARTLRPHSPAAPQFAQACIIAPDTVAPIWSPPVPAPTPASEDDEDEDEDEEDEEEDDEAEDEDTVRGFRTEAGAPCIAITGSVSAGFQITRRKLSPGVKALAGALDTVSFLPGSSMRLVAIDETSFGRLETAFGLNLLPSTDPDAPGVQITEAKVALAGWTIGLDASRFTFWDGDGFQFAARIPGRNAHQITKQWQLTESLTFSLGIEDARTDSNAQAPNLPPPAGRLVPDIVAQARFETDTLSAVLAGVIAERRSTDPTIATVWGMAGLVGATASFDAIGTSHRLTAQLAVARDAPGYLGTQLDRRFTGRIVSGHDRTVGYSAILALSQDWTETVTANLYVSSLRLFFPQVGLTGGLGEISRGAASVVWSPVKNMRIGLEGGLSRSRIELGGRAVLEPAGRQRTILVWLERSF